MRLLKVLNRVSKLSQPVVNRVEHKLKEWTKPVSETLVTGTVTDLLKSKPALAVCRRG